MKIKTNQEIKGRFTLSVRKLPWGWRKLVQFLSFIGRSDIAASIASNHGVLKWKTSWIENGTTNAGKAQYALLAGDASATPFAYLEVGTSATAFNASQTALQAAITDTGLARASATVSRVTTNVTNDTLQLVKVWTATGSKTVEEIGYFNASSAGTMGGRALTGSKAIDNEETLTATYQVIFT